MSEFKSRIPAVVCLDFFIFGEEEFTADDLFNVSVIFSVFQLEIAIKSV